MNRSILVALAIFFSSSIIIGRVLFGTPVNPLVGWDYALLVASFGFLGSLAYLVTMCARYWFQIGPSVGPFAAWAGIVISPVIFAGSIIMIFLPENWKIFSDHTRNILTLWSLLTLFVSTLYFTPR